LINQNIKLPRTAVSPLFISGSGHLSELIYFSVFQLAGSPIFLCSFSVYQ